MKNCSSCNKEVEKYDNAFHKLCRICNLKRLEQKKESKVDKNILRRKSTVDPKNRLNHKVKQGIKPKKVKESKASREIALDEEFYEKAFKACKDHRCENCGVELPDRFRDEEGRIIARWRYSHIIPKSIARRLRRVLKNINHLCRDCHTEWDHGDKKSMKIYEENKKKFPRYLK